MKSKIESGDFLVWAGPNSSEGLEGLEGFFEVLK